MTKITFLVGPPGSGKTFLGNELVKHVEQKPRNELAKEGSFFIDDVSLVGFQAVKEAIEKYDHVVIADVFLCREKERQKAQAALSDCEIEWIFFENNLDKCLRNVEKRADGRKVEQLIHLLHREYTIPEGVIPRSVFTTS